MKANTVYLIDDEPELVNLLGEIVEIAGANAKSYTRASEFLNKLGHSKQALFLYWICSCRRSMVLR